MGVKTDLKREPKPVYRGRLVHLELMKIMAIFMVVFVHNGTRGGNLWAVVQGFKTQSAYMFLDVSCRVAIPLFLMSSGAVLLGRVESIGTVFRKRVSKFALVLFLISLCYWGRSDMVNGPVETFGDFLKFLYCSEMYWHLWYLYAFIGLMLMLPLLRRLAQNMSGQEFVYMALMHLLFVGVIPIVEYLLWRRTFHLNTQLTTSIFTLYNVVYFLLGYYLEHKMPEKYRNGKLLAVGIVLSIAANAACTLLTMYRASILGELTVDNSAMFKENLAMIPAVTIFIGTRMLFRKVAFPDWVYRIIIWIGGTTFGIYLFDDFLRQWTEGVFLLVQPWVGTLFAGITWSVAAIILGAVLITLVRKIPGVRSLL